MAPSPDHHSFGLHKPVGHVLLVFAGADAAEAGVRAVAAVARGEPRRWSDREMLEQADAELAQAGVLAKVGQEYNLVRDHRDRAARGGHFVAVAADDDEQARAIAEAARGAGAERAQWYGRFIVEELIDPPGGGAQVAESVDRGLDVDTPPENSRR
jgi:hypothetical protein